MGRFLLVAVLTTCLAARAAPAQTAPADTTAAGGLDLSDTQIRVDLWPPKLHAYGLVWLPNGTATSRTGLGVGLDTVLPYTLQHDRNSLTSELALSFTVTTKGQWRVKVSSDLHWNENRNFARVSASYDDLAREFWGIGPGADGDDREEYGPRDLQTVIEATWHLPGQTLAVGPHIGYQHHDARDLEDGGQLDSGEVPGVSGEAMWGLGLVINWDRRDDRYQPTAGWYVQGRVVDVLAGGSHQPSFWSAVVDWRGYGQAAERHVYAGQIYLESAGEGAPFWRLASMGHAAHSRAYPRDRWLDDLLLAGQMEWRWQALDRWGVVGFGGIAAVADDLGSLALKYVRPTVGCGLRYITRQGVEDVPLRLDFAVGYQHWSVLLGIGEAF